MSQYCKDEAVKDAESMEVATEGRAALRGAAHT